MSSPHTSDESEHLLTQRDGLGVIYSPAEARFEGVIQVAKRLFGVPLAAIALMDERTLWFESRQTAATHPPRPCIARTLDRDGALVIADLQTDPECATEVNRTTPSGLRFYAGHPVSYAGRPVGVLYLLDHQPRTLSLEDEYLLASLAGWVESELNVTALSAAQTQLLKEKSEAERNSLVDPLTKLWNRTAMDYLLVRELSAAQRKGQAVSLMLIDIDNFTQLKARQGEAGAQAALKEVAARVRAAVRPHDVLVRFAADRYLLFAADCTEERALQLAERILNRVASQHISDGRRYFSVQVSAGLAAAQAKQGLAIRQLLQKAEQALKEAKGAGRNCARAVTV